MTCIVGIEWNGKVYLGADTASSAGWTKRELIEPKVCKNGRFAIGLSGTLRMAQLVQYDFAPPDDESNLYDMRYMVSAFVPALRSCLKDAGHATIDNNKEGHDSYFLVGVRDKLYRVGSDYAVLRCADRFDAIGSGGDFALSLLWYHLKHYEAIHARKVLTLALEAAAHFANGVSSNFNFVETESGE